MAFDIPKAKGNINDDIKDVSPSSFIEHEVNDDSDAGIFERSIIYNRTTEL